MHNHKTQERTAKVDNYEKVKDSKTHHKNLKNIWFYLIYYVFVYLEFLYKSHSKYSDTTVNKREIVFVLFRHCNNNNSSYLCH